MGPVSIDVEVQRNTDGDTPSKANNAMFALIRKIRVLNRPIEMQIDFLTNLLNRFYYMGVKFGPLEIWILSKEFSLSF